MISKSLRPRFKSKQMKYKILSTLVILCVISSKLHAQTISRSVIPTNGGYYAGSSIQVSYTLGETFTKTLSQGNIILTQGFQQPIPYNCPFALYNGIDTIAACDTVYTLDAGAGYTSYQWGNGESTQTINVASCSDNLRTISLPIDPAAPVTITTLSLKFSTTCSS